MDFFYFSLIFYSFLVDLSVVPTEIGLIPLVGLRQPGGLAPAAALHGGRAGSEGQREQSEDAGGRDGHEGQRRALKMGGFAIFLLVLMGFT